VRVGDDCGVVYWTSAAAVTEEKEEFALAVGKAVLRVRFFVVDRLNKDGTAIGIRSVRSEYLLENRL
jgi:hypothetical protein